jgi:hypothetical protein
MSKGDVACADLKLSWHLPGVTEGEKVKPQRI